MRKLLLILPILLCRCSSMEKSIGLGVGVGAVAGVAASQMAHYNTKGAIVMGLTGVAIGGALAAILHKDPEPTPPVPAISILKNNPPPLKHAEQDVLWVPDKIEGERFEEAHRVFVIKRPAHWQLYPAKPDKKEDTNSKEVNQEEGDQDE